MTVPEVHLATIYGHGKNRKVGCPACGKEFSRSVLPHIKKEHPAIWQEWRKQMLKAYNSGMIPKKIMRECFTVNGRPLFTWGVIEKEIRRMVSEGEDVKFPVRKRISSWEPEDFKLEESTVWKFRRRGNWATHCGDYRGNWPPEIPRNLIIKYTKLGDTVLDCFMGGGTTIVECKLLGRNAIGCDINPFSLTLTKEHLSRISNEARRQNRRILRSRSRIFTADARYIPMIKDNSVDLICTHPPYFNKLKYTEKIQGDLSWINSINDFVGEIKKVADQCLRVLKSDHRCCILIGDVRINGMICQLGFMTMNAFFDAGFILEEIIVKEQFNDRSTAFYVNQGFLRISHEYLFIFRKLKKVSPQS